MSQIKLSGTYKVLKVLKKTSASGFKQVTEGYIFSISVDLEKSRGAAAGTYVPQLKVTMTPPSDSFLMASTALTRVISWNTLVLVLQNFQLQPQ